MHQLGKDWWKEVGRRFVDGGEQIHRCRGAVLGGYYGLWRNGLAG